VISVTPTVTLVMEVLLPIVNHVILDGLLPYLVSVNSTWVLVNVPPINLSRMVNVMNVMPIVLPVTIGSITLVPLVPLESSSQVDNVLTLVPPVLTSSEMNVSLVTLLVVHVTDGTSTLVLLVPPTGVHMVDNVSHNVPLEPSKETRPVTPVGPDVRLVLIGSKIPVLHVSKGTLIVPDTVSKTEDDCDIKSSFLVHRTLLTI